MPNVSPPLSSSTLLDNDAVDEMKVVADITPSIWESMQGLVGDIISAKFDVSEALVDAKVLAKRPSDKPKAVRESDPTTGTKALRDDTTASAKVCPSRCFNIDLRPANLAFWLPRCFCVLDGDFIVQCVQESWSRKTAAGRPTSENDPFHECD